MSADGALSGVCGLAFAVELQERAHENRVSSGRGAIIPLEGRGGFARHIRPARGQFGIHGVAEIFHATPAVGEIRDPVQIPPAAVARGDRAKRAFGFADDVEPAPQSARRGHAGASRPWRSSRDCGPRLRFACADRARGLSPARRGRSAPRPRRHGPEPGRNARLTRRRHDRPALMSAIRTTRPTPLGRRNMNGNRPCLLVASDVRRHASIEARRGASLQQPTHMEPSSNRNRRG